MLTNLRRCAKCALPETHETILFDEEGVCNICRATEHKQGQIDWASKRKELDLLIEQHRDKGDYDCIVPFSGGKDSTWTLYFLVKNYGLRPLVVRFDHGFLRQNVIDNTTRTLRRLGVDFHHFTPSWKVVQKLMLQSFLEKGDFCWHCHTGIFSYPMWVALRHQVPLVFWGEPSAEYTAYYDYEGVEEVDEKRFNRFVNLGITAEDMFLRLGGKVPMRELKPFSYPPQADLRRLKYRSVCLGSFIPWDPKTQSETIMRELGWKGDLVENTPPEYNYEKIECQMQGVRDYIKYIKRGYTRPTHLVSLDLRNNRMDRYQALQIIDQYEGKRPPSLDLFLEYVGLTEEEFLEIATGHQVSPHQHDQSKIQPGQATPDNQSWLREGAMNRDEALEQVAAFRAQGFARA